MKSRITLSLTENGQFELWLNEAGRDELIELLQSLDRVNEHLHITPEGHDGDCVVSEIAYSSTDHVLSWGKVLFRLDEWDQQYFPHVMGGK